MAWEQKGVLTAMVVSDAAGAIGDVIGAAALLHPVMFCCMGTYVQMCWSLLFMLLPSTCACCCFQGPAYA